MKAKKYVLTFPVSEPGTFLSTRGTGAHKRSELEAVLRSASPAPVLEIDFTGTEAMTHSFVDEFLGKFYVSLAAGDVQAVGVRLVGLNEETRESVAVCLERRKQFAVQGEDHTLLGDTNVMADTYAQARKLGAFRAQELADALGISVTNANNRLKRLVQAGALSRDRAPGPERGGKEFMYTLP
ncbi:winged helix-turn-helix transcriptional regulator [Streptomyces blattellae]|uniref:winged helix-turn-helix transcriptional regulator n=1 Tax=Streptomyces blattellae TaxID=2569855 RepID=UPI0018ACAA2D|nr:winged helix-turn-helix transcriptional regulator [Streptomyces blattellae]